MFGCADGVLTLPAELEISENVTGGLLEICTALESGGTLETELIITLAAVDDIAGEIFKCKLPLTHT